jgi:hypothetical protein
MLPKNLANCFWRGDREIVAMFSVATKLYAAQQSVVGHFD